MLCASGKRRHEGGAYQPLGGQAGADGARGARAGAGVLRADPIAIVGMACRVPGGGDSPGSVWQLLVAGVDAVREVPRERWDADAWFDPDPAAPGKMSTRCGGLPRPHRRVRCRLLRHPRPRGRAHGPAAAAARSKWRSRRSTTPACPPSGCAAAAPACSSPATTTTTRRLQYDDLEAIDPRTLTGTLHSVLPNRLSYFLDLRGPEHLDRHRVLVVAGGDASRLPEPALRRERRRPRRRRVADRRAADFMCRCRRSASWRPTAAARPSMRAPTASAAARAAASSC